MNSKQVDSITHASYFTSLNNLFYNNCKLDKVIISLEGTTVI